MTHGHSDLHAWPLDIVEVEVMEHHKAQGATRQACCIAQSFVQSIHVLRIITFKVSDHLPQENGLDNFNNFLDEGKDELNHAEDNQHPMLCVFHSMWCHILCQLSLQYASAICEHKVVITAGFSKFLHTYFNESKDSKNSIWLPVAINDSFSEAGFS